LSQGLLLRQARSTTLTLIKEMLDAGVRGYVLKSDAVRDLVLAVDALQHGKTFFTSRRQRRIVLPSWSVSIVTRWAI